MTGDRHSKNKKPANLRWPVKKNLRKIESSVFDTDKIQHDSLNELYRNKERLCKKAQLLCDETIALDIQASTGRVYAT